MVDPSVSDEDREDFLVRFRVGFALLVGVSMALIAVNGSATPTLIVGVGVGGTAAGAVLAWWVFPDSMVLGYANRR